MKLHPKQLDWIDGVKAFAILAILLNHSVESFSPGPWFSNPSSVWPTLPVRLASLFPRNGSLFVRIVQFLGGLGDMGPGVFLLLSGLTLTLSALNKPLLPLDFYRKRLLRIYPLYVVVHLIILLVANAWFKWNIPFLSVPTLLSLLGLRFTGSLFFYINPSWWFIWTILQMYLLFPFLLHFLQSKGVRVFLLLTLAITILSRSYGILFLIHSRNLYDWMTGIFAGTRLFEFAFGMSVAYCLRNENRFVKNLLASRSKVLVYSLLCYVTGFTLGWTYAGSIFSNIFITLGLCGVFYAIFALVCRENFRITGGVLWIGRNSFSVFLLHQPFMMYLGPLFKGFEKGLVLLIVIILSFVTGYFIEKWIVLATNKFQSHRPTTARFLASKLNLRLIVTAIVLAAATSFAIMLGFARFGGMLKVELIVLFLGIGITRSNLSRVKSPYTARFFDIVAIVSLVAVFLTANWFSTYWLVVAVSWLPLMATSRLKHVAAVLISVTVIAAGIFSTEFYLRKKRPVEVLAWGEFPALRMDAATVYSLIPNKTTHLKYNNYDYYVRTNSYGFNSPEINLPGKSADEKRIMVLGDAFSMPEGMDYNRSYGFLLERQLRSSCPQLKINVVNAGVTGYGPNEEYDQLNKYIGLVRPDIVIDQFFINDFDDINILRNQRREGIGFFMNHSLKKKYLEDDQTPLQLDDWAQNILGVTNKAEAALKTLLPFYKKNASFYKDSVIDKVSHYFDEMNTLCTLHHAQLIVMYVPGQIEVSQPKDISFYPYFENLHDTTRYDFIRPQHIADSLCTEKKITYLNTTSYLKAHTPQPVYFKESWHWNQEGHKAIGSYLANFLLSHHLL